MSNIIELTAKAEADCRENLERIATARESIDKFADQLREKAKANYENRLAEIDVMCTTIKEHVSANEDTLISVCTALSGAEK